MRHLLLSLFALPLLSACGGDTGQAASDSVLQLFSCGVAEPEITLSGDLEVSSDGFDSGITIYGLSDSSSTLTGYSASTTAEPALRDGIIISLYPEPIEINIGSDPEPADVGITAPDSCDGVFVLEADGMPTHTTGPFPNTENPYSLVAVPRTYEIPAQPDYPDAIHPLLANRLDGVLLNGVPIQMRETDCAESWCDSWHVNPLYEPSWYGIDDHNGHVLSDGSYHYHGNPGVLYDGTGTVPFVVIGVAADGFPIFGPWVSVDGVVRKALSSYSLKDGERPTDGSAPSGFYTGAYVEDYEYVAASGDLDECNGAWVGDIYGYFVTDTFPYILNCLRGEPQPSFDLTLE